MAKANPDFWIGLREDGHPIGVFPGDKAPDHWNQELLVPVWTSKAGVLKLLLWRLGLGEIDLSDDAFPTAKVKALIEKHYQRRE